MPRKLRIEYPGAIYHACPAIAGRFSEGGCSIEATSANIFKDDQDRKKFLGTLGEACAKTEWQVHAYCLMRNHFHPVIETPQANLVAGMKWLAGVYTKRFNPNAPMQGPPTSSTVLVNLGMSIEPAAHGLPLRTE